MTNLTVAYHKDSWIGVRFIDNFRFAIKKDIGSREGCPPNLCERISTIGLWLVEEFPRKAFKALSDPRFVTLAITVLSLEITSLCFYPTMTIDLNKRAIQLLPRIPYWAVKFATYLVICETIIAYWLRAESRFCNIPLKAAFYR